MEGANQPKKMAQRSEFRRKPQRVIRQFSESFKRAKVKEIERNLTTVRQVSKEFEVSDTAVYNWVYKYSAYRRQQVRQIVEPMSDARKIKELRARIEELEKLVGQKQIQLEFKEKMIELAEELYQVDIKKKFGLRPSSGSGSTGKSTGGK